MLNRRGFLGALTAPFLVRPSLEDIERLTWRKRFFPGYRPAEALTPEEFTKAFSEAVLRGMERHFVLARQINRTYEADVLGTL